LTDDNSLSADGSCNKAFFATVASVQSSAAIFENCDADEAYIDFLNATLML
jgi:hypothetical protein